MRPLTALVLGELDIVERLRERHEKRESSSAWREVICAYEEERDDAADEIQRLRHANDSLCDQICALHATGEENDYSQFERIRELEEVLQDMLRAVSQPIQGESVYGGASSISLRGLLLRYRRGWTKDQASRKP